MNISIHTPSNPDRRKLNAFFNRNFNAIDPIDAAKFPPEADQDQLEQWIDLDFALMFSKEHGIVIEARTDQDKLAGAIIAGKQNPISWPDGQKWEIYILATDSTFRRQGIARILIESMEKEAQKQGAKSIIVNAHVFFESSKQLFQSCGYQVMGTLSNYYDNGDALFLSKKLWIR